MPRRRRRTSKAAAAPARRPAVQPDAEPRLLALAQAIAVLAEGPTPIVAALHALACEHAPDGQLPAAVGQAWLKSRGDKTAALSLAWAREQVRLALRDTLERMPAPKGRALPVDTDTLAWLLLAACEALAHEPPSAVADRVRSLFELIGCDAPPA